VPNCEKTSFDSSRIERPVKDDNVKGIAHGYLVYWAEGNDMRGRDICLLLSLGESDTSCLHAIMETVAIRKKGEREGCNMTKAFIC
jgi:hypothetical protein